MAIGDVILRKKRFAKVKLETTKGTKVAGDQAILTENLEINPTGPYIERKANGLYRGHSAKGVIGANSGQCSFEVELRGTGAGGCETGLAILLQACCLAKTSEVYQIHSTHANDKTISIDVWEDGKKKGLAGASGTFTIDAEAGGRIMLKFTLSGIWQTVADEAMPAFAPSALLPLMFKGGTFTIATNAIKINKFAFDMGVDVQPREDGAATNGSGIAYFMTADALPMLSIDPEAQKVADYDFYGLWAASTEAAIVLIAKNATDQCTISIPKLQYREVKEGERTGKMIYDINGQCNHSSGNDSVTLTFAAAA
jgi:hypothetical protein